MARRLGFAAPLFAGALLCSTCATGATTPPAGNVVAIGFVVPLTGPDRANAEPAIQGATVAIADVNSHQTAGARRLQLVQVNDASDAATAEQVCSGLVSTHQVAAIVGVESAGPGAACASVAGSAGVPYLLVGSGAPSECTANVVHIGSVPDQRVGALVQFLIQQRHLSRFYEVGDGSTDDVRLLAAASAQIAAFRGAVVATESLSSNPDFAQLGRRIAAARPDVTVEALGGAVQARYYAAITSEPELARIPLASLDMDEAAADGIGAGASGIYLARDYLSTDPGAGNQAWLAALMSRYGDGAVPTSLGAQANDAIELLATSIRIAGSARPPAIMPAMTNVSLGGPRGSVEIKAAAHGYPTLTLHVGRLDSEHRVTQLYVTQPMDPNVDCRLAGG